MVRYKTDKGILLEEFDDSIGNIREDYDHYSKFYTFLRNTNSPDKCDYWDFKSWLFGTLPSNSAKRVDSAAVKNGGVVPSILIKEAAKNGIVLLPVFRYKHSDTIYRAMEENPFHCSFDSCMAGVIYAERADIIKEYGNMDESTIEIVKGVLKAEVDEYSSWANGECYCYCLRTGDPDDGSDDEWIGGFIGDVDVNGIRDEFDIESIELIG